MNWTNSIDKILSKLKNIKMVNNAKVEEEFNGKYSKLQKKFNPAD